MVHWNNGVVIINKNVKKNINSIKTYYRVILLNRVIIKLIINQI